MTRNQMKVVSAIAYLCSTGVANAEHFERKHFREVAGIAKTRIPWSVLSGYMTDERIKSYNFTTLIDGVDPVKPQTDTNIAKVVSKKTPVATPDTPPEVEKEDVAILDKYNHMIPEGKKYSQNVNDIIVVSKPNDGGGIIGLARTFDTAWDVHKMYRFHDLGEFSDREAVEKYFNEHGRVVLKSGNANLFVIFERMEIQI